MTPYKILPVLTVALLGSLLPVAAYARDDHPGKKGQRPAMEKEDHAEIKIDDSTGEIIADFLRILYPELKDSKPVRASTSHCPPGLAKKNAACLPPGITRKYALGEPLPPGLARPIPADLAARLHAPAHGYHYVQVDKDILLIAEATKKVVDVVTLISAVGD
jgi:hypothetical protein